LSNGEPNREPRVDPVAAIVWVALILGTVLDVRVPIHGGGPGREINLSLFDVALPIALAYAAITRRIVFELIPWRIIAGLALAAVVIAVHSAIAYRYGTWTPIPRLAGPVEVVRLARETIKLVTIPVELAMLMMLFTANEFRLPPVWVVITVAGVVAAIMVFERIRFLFDNIPYFANIEANTLTGIMVLAVWMRWSGRPGYRLFTLGITIGVTIVMVIAIRKTYLMVCGVTLALLVVSFIRDCIENKNYRLLRKGCLLLAATTALVLGIHVVMTRLFYLGHGPLDIIFNIAGHSSEIRFEIQDVAWHLALVALPFGIGIGQFGALIPRIPELEDYAIAFAHNTPLSLFLDMGVVGLALAVGLFYLIYLACCGGSLVSRLSRAAFFVIPMMVNDTHGLRMTILLIGFFIAALLINSKITTNESKWSRRAGIGPMIGAALLLCLMTLSNAGSAYAGNVPDGASCQSDEDCVSRACYAGPSNTGRYCVNSNRNCAAPGNPGYYYGDTLIHNGQLLGCEPPVVSQDRAGWRSGVGPGATCSKNQDCLSGSICGSDPTGTARYCVARDQACASPGTPGLRYGQSLAIDGQTYVCAPPVSAGNGPVWNLAHPDGETCSGPYDCVSGRCVHGPIGNATYCVAAGQSCGAPGSSGYRYGESMKFAGKDYVCRPSEPAEKGPSWGIGQANGETCSSKYDCPSARCLPGPLNNGLEYCAASERHCAAPGHDGFDLNDVVSIGGHFYRCRDYPPGTGPIWRAYDPLFIKPKNPTILNVH
jgi:O-antigen ligase